MQVGEKPQAAEELLLAQTVRCRMEFSSSRGTIAAPNVKKNPRNKVKLIIFSDSNIYVVKCGLVKISQQLSMTLLSIL